MKTGQKSKRVLLIILLFTKVIATIAQLNATAPSASVGLPSILMPSPEAASITRANAMSVSINTGTASATLPLYEIKLKELTVPLSLNYFSTGVHVDEIPGRTGIGWSLSAGGVIARLVHGKPDDQAARMRIPAVMDASDTAFKHFVENLSQVGYDNEPDEFKVSAPGLHGKFILDDRNKPLFIPYSNLKVEVLDGPRNGSKYGRFKVTNVNGIEYFFGYGNSIETAISHGILSSITFSSTRTSFFLTKIKSPGGDSVEFRYDTIHTSAITGISFTMQAQSSNVYNSGLSCDCAIAAANSVETMNEVTYSTVYLSSIVASNGVVVNFGYEGRGDQSQDNRLKTVIVSNGKFSKSWRCDYTEFDYGGVGQTHANFDFNRRFFLTKLVEFNRTHSDSLVYGVEYDSPEQLPQRLSYSQDHWGYYNGVLNTNLLPPADGFPVSGQNAANREPNGNSNGMLKKIYFPTGGYQEFVTEPNISSRYQPITTVGTRFVSGSGDYTAGWVTYYSDSFSVERSQVGNLKTSGYSNSGCESCTPTPPNTMIFLRALLVVAATDSVVYSQVSREYSDFSWPVNLDSGVVYRVKLMVKNLANAGTVTVTYEPEKTPVYQLVETLAGGVRVKSIVSYDPVSGKSLKKFYKYTSLNSPASSCLNTSTDISYTTPTVYLSVCYLEGFSFPMYNQCNYQNLNSSTPQPLFMFDDSHLSYTSVIESDDEQFKTGLTHHEYEVNLDQSVDQLFGNPIHNLPTGIVTSINGYEARTSYYDNEMHLVKRTENFYNLHPEKYAQLDTAYVFYQRYRPGFGMPVNSQGEFVLDVGAYSGARYLYVSNWLRLDSAAESEYDTRGNAMRLTKYYEYGTAANISPRGNYYYDSKGNKRSEKYYYANDMLSSVAATTAVSRNMIDKPWRTERYLNTSFLDSATTIHKDWFNNGSLIKPEKVYIYSGATAGESRLRYYAYDAMGNELELSKEGDEHIAYVWDYHKSLPVAEVKNASANDVAYSSFESEGNGNFIYDAAGIDTANALTGHNAFNLSGSRTIQKTGLNTSLHYIVSYWLKNSSGSQSLSAGTATAVANRREWTLYQADITGVSSVTISGSGILDEVRICPANAQVSSFTYEPLVGITTQNDNNNRIRYFEYDDFGRLKRVRDMDGNIISSYEYQYKKTF